MKNKYIIINIWERFPHLSRTYQVYNTHPCDSHPGMLRHLSFILIFIITIYYVLFFMVSAPNQPILGTDLIPEVIHLTPNAAALSSCLDHPSKGSHVEKMSALTRTFNFDHFLIILNQTKIDQLCKFEYVQFCFESYLNIDNRFLIPFKSKKPISVYYNYSISVRQYTNLLLHVVITPYSCNHHACFYIDIHHWLVAYMYRQSFIVTVFSFPFYDTSLEITVTIILRSSLPVRCRSRLFHL